MPLCPRASWTRTPVPGIHSLASHCVSAMRFVLLALPTVASRLLLITLKSNRLQMGLNCFIPWRLI